jgi:hypothetical protein
VPHLQVPLQTLTAQLLLTCCWGRLDMGAAALGWVKLGAGINHCWLARHTMLNPWLAAS